jgi:hypothetical protein
MKRFFARNLDAKGRVLRGVLGVALLIGAGCSVDSSLWLALVLAAAGVFGIFEALRGWCLARACGIKTNW